MEEIHSSMVKFFNVNVSCRGSVLPFHGYPAKLAIKLAVEFEIIADEGKGEKLEDDFIRTKRVGIFHEGLCGRF